MLDSIFGLNGRGVLITGAAGLLGQRHAEAVLMAGGQAILTDVDASRLEHARQSLEAKYDRAVIAMSLDITREDSIRDVHAELTRRDIAVDVLVNNAARNPAVGAHGLANSGRLEHFDPVAWQADVAVGLTGAILCSKVFGAAMAERGRGVIVNVASDLGVIAPDQRLYRVDGRADEEQDVKPVSYSVVKHGLVGLTKYLATYWAHRGVRCNSLSPGGVQTNQSEVFLGRISQLIPLGRMAKINELEGAMIFLCSDASAYMNGANLVVDGGRSVW